MAVLETHIFKAHNNIYIEQPEENWIIKVVEGLPKLLRVFREGLA